MGTSNQLATCDDEDAWVSVKMVTALSFLFIGTVSCWGMGTSNQLATGDDEDAWVPVKMGGKQIQDKYVDS